VHTHLHEEVTKDPPITEEHHQQIKTGVHSKEIVVIQITEEAKTKTKVKTMTKKIVNIVNNLVTLLKNALNSKPKKPQWR
jgi:type II secretory pathway component PulF